MYLNYQIPPVPNNSRQRWEGANLVTFLTRVSLVMLSVEAFTRDQEKSINQQNLENCVTILKFLIGNLYPYLLSV